MGFSKGNLGTRKGFSFTEVLIGAAVFALVAVTIYQSYTSLLVLVYTSRTKTLASALANEQFEIIRNLPYADVGILGGVPTGKLQRFQTFTRSSVTFQSTTTIRNVDDPFDGMIGSTTAPDLAPADYKVVEIEIGCAICNNFQPLIFTTNIAPKNLETSSTNGALFVKVFDANGTPIQDARIQVVNPSSTPAIAIDEVSNASGQLQLVDVPPGINQYQITVSKNGYSTDKTYQPGASGNPNPLKPHATVALQQVTQVSFAIDKTSIFNFSTVQDTCAPVPNTNFTLSGTRLIGTGPNVLKYSSSQTTDGSGNKTVSGLEWDTYSAVLNSASYVLKGTIPLLPFSLSPNSTQNVALVLEPPNPRELLVTIKDAGSGLPLTDANVELGLGSYDSTLTTDRGFIKQNNWEGGPGQATSSDTTKFFSTNGNVDYLGFPGEVRLKSIFGNYQTPGEMESSTFDLGSPSNFYQILWNPGSEPPETGPSSVKFQIATNASDPGTTTWNFFGPDGTGDTYYTTANQNIASLHNGDRYLRYRMILSTASTTATPSLSDVSITYTSSCVPPGQVLFSSIPSTGQATLTVTKAGYQVYTAPVSINASYQSFDVSLTP
jgi:hypothetical protein